MKLPGKPVPTLVVLLVLVLPLLLLVSFKKKQKANWGDKHNEI